MLWRKKYSIFWVSQFTLLGAGNESLKQCAMETRDKILATPGRDSLCRGSLIKSYHKVEPKSYIYLFANFTLKLSCYCSYIYTYNGEFHAF